MDNKISNQWSLWVWIVYSLLSKKDYIVLLKFNMVLILQKGLLIGYWAKATELRAVLKMKVPMKRSGGPVDKIQSH